MKQSSPSRMGKRQLRDLLRRTRKRLFDSVSRLTEGQMYHRVEAGEASIAEVLAHLAPAERAIRDEAEAVVREGKGSVTLPSPEQEREWAALADQMVPPQIVNDLVGARWQTLRFLDSVGSGDLARPAAAPGSTLSVAAVIRLIADHEEEHIGQIMRLRRIMEQRQVQGQ